MAKTKKIFGLFLLSMMGAYSAIQWGIQRDKQRLQEENGYDENEATSHLLNLRNEEINRKKDNIKNSGNIFQKIKLMTSLFFLESERLSLEFDASLLNSKNSD